MTDEHREGVKTGFWGSVMLAGGFLFWLYLVGNPLSDLALIRRGVTAHGVVTALEEEREVGDDRRTHVFLYATYTFKLPDGTPIEASTDDVYADTPRNIEVEYLPDNPSVSRIKGTGSPTIKDWLWRKCGLGGLLLIMFLAPGLGMLSGVFTRKPKA